MAKQTKDDPMPEALAEKKVDKVGDGEEEEEEEEVRHGIYVVMQHHRELLL